MKSYIFPIIVEPDEDRWFAKIPELEQFGGATWGSTREEAVRNIQEVGQMVIEELLADSKPLPSSVKVSEQTVAAVCI